MKTDGQIAWALGAARRSLYSIRDDAKAQDAPNGDVLACVTKAIFELECAEEIIRNRIKAAKK